MPGQTLFWEFLVGDKATAPMTRIAGAADRTAVSMDRAAVSTDRASAGFFGLSKALAGGAGVAVALGFSVGKAIQFQKSMTLIQTQAGASAKQVKSFSSALLSLSGRVATAPDQLATSLYHAFSATHNYAQSLNVAKIAAEGAKVGNADLEQTTNALTSTVVAGIGGVKNMSQAMGALNAIVGAGDMKLSDLNQALGTGLLAQAKTFGVSIQQVGGALAVFGDNNIRGADAATKLRMVMQDLAKPAANADQVLSQIHVTSSQLQDALTGPGHLTAALELLSTHMHAAGVTGSHMGAFLEDAFTKKAGAGLAILIQQLGRYELKTKEVQDGANKFGAAWVATTHTAAFQLQRLGAEFESAAITVGTKLLPVVTKVDQVLADTLPKAGHAISAVFGPIGGFVAPALPMFTKLALAAGGAWAVMRVGGAVMSGLENAWVLGRVRLLELGDAFTTAATKSLTFASTAKVALGAAGFGLAIGMMTRESSTGTKAIGAFASAAAGAVMGFQVGGPWGAAIGGGVGLLTSLATAFTGADKAQQQLTKDTQTFAQALEAANGKVSDTVFDKIRSQLQDKGLLAEIKAFGISTSAVATGIAKGGDALDPVIAKLQEVAKQRRQADIGGFVQWIPTDEAKRAQSLLGSLREVNQSFMAGRRNAQRYLQTHLVVTKQTQNETAATGAATIATDLNNAAQDTATITLKGLVKSMQTYVTAQLSTKSASLGYRESLLTLGQQVKSTGTSLSANTAKGVANRQMLVGLLQSAEQAAEGSKNYGAALRARVQDFVKYATGAGYGRKALKDLLDQMHLLPGQIKVGLNVDHQKGDNDIANFQDEINRIKQGQIPGLTADSKPGVTIINDLQRMIDDIRQHHPAKLAVDRAQVALDIAELQGKINNIHGKSVPIQLVPHGAAASEILKMGYGLPAVTGGRAFADGGMFRGAGGPRSDSNIVAVSDGEYIVNAKASQQFFPLIDAINNAGLGFARGGAIDLNVTSSKLLNALTGGISVKMPTIGSGYSGGGALSQWISEALAITGTPASWAGAIYRRIMFESGGNPNAINLTDSNAAAGHPSQGLMQTIPSTFNAYHVPGTSYNIDNPVANIAAAIGYIKSRYGSIAAIDPPVAGYATGGPVGHHKKRNHRRHYHHQQMAQARDTFRSQQHPNQIISADGQWWVNGQAYGRRDLAAQALQQQQVQDRRQREQSLKQARGQATNSLRSGLYSFIHALGSPSSERKAFHSLLPDLRTLGAGDKWIAHLEKQNDRLGRAIARHNKALSALDKARATLHADIQARNQLRSSVTGAGRGVFDITGAGANPVTGKITAGSMLAQEKQALTKIKAWSSGLEKLRREGLSRQYLSQLAQAGPDSLPQVQALLTGGPKLLRQMNGIQGEINRDTKQFGTYVGGQVYGQRIKGDRADVRADKRTLRLDTKDVDRLARAIGNEITKREHEPMHAELDVQPGTKKLILRWVREEESKMQKHHPRQTAAKK